MINLKKILQKLEANLPRLAIAENILQEAIEFGQNSIALKNY
jgi:hypothetical protein